MSLFVFALYSKAKKIQKTRFKLSTHGFGSCISKPVTVLGIIKKKSVGQRNEYWKGL